MTKLSVTIYALIFLMRLPAIAQQNINFTKTNAGAIQSTDFDPEKNYQQPFKLVFDKTKFKNGSITFFTDVDHKKTIIGTMTFEKEILAVPESGKYEIQVENNAVIIDKDNQQSIAGSQFVFTVDNKSFDKVIKVQHQEPRDENPSSAKEKNITGIPYYDAVLINDLKKTAPAKISQVLATYRINNQTDLDANPFLKDEVRGAFGTFTIQGKGGISLSGIVSGIGNTNVTNFADGLAKFLVERAKEELNVAFFDKFKEFIAHYPEANTLFPTTMSFLKDVKSYQYAAMLPALRAAFHKDMNELGDGLLKLREPLSCPDGDNECADRTATIHTFLNDKTAGRSMMASVVLTNGIIKGKDAATAINDMASDDCTLKDDNLSNFIFMADLISQSIKSNNSDHVWISKQEASLLLQKDERVLKLYLGLLYATDQNNKKIHFLINGNPVSLKDVLTKLHDAWPNADQINTILAFKKSLKNMTDAAADASGFAYVISNKAKNDDDGSMLIYADYAASVSSLIKSAVAFLPANDKLDTHLATLKTELNVVSNVIDNAVNCAYDIKSKNYGALVLHTSSMLEMALEKKYTFKDKYIKYATFMANIIEAQNSDEVKNAIEAAVLPVGSSSIKRETPFNISLNAYIGGFGGKEFNTYDIKASTGSIYGVTAPLGVAFSWGHHLTKMCGDKARGGKSHTLFVSLINVGNIAAYRIKDTSTALTSEIKLKDIIAPGVSYYFGFGKVPISFGTGFELSPQYSSGTDVQTYYPRWFASLVVDIPVFNLYTKTE